MKKIAKIPIKQSYSFIVSFLLLVSLAMPAFAQEKFICVWRNPERTMTRLFPKAKDYKTKTVDISAKKLTLIEKRLGSEVLAGQRTQFQYFEMLDAGGVVIGYTFAVTQKGEFGAIEFVFGLSATHEISGIYIQRARERNRQFKEASFLETFVGKKVKSVDALVDPLGEKGNIGTMALINGVRKELIAFDELVLKQ